ncbi:hypothetical protein [Streptomyces malaysiensis]|uniref:hypothetical protein n=1 Tax=Streptomyces malaysiensis TaxID=92644 RepID=UPI003710931B
MELLWSAIKTRELANLTGDHLADTAERAIRRVSSDGQLPWSFLTHTRLTIHTQPPTELTKTSVSRSLDRPEPVRAAPGSVTWMSHPPPVCPVGAGNYVTRDDLLVWICQSSAGRKPF